MKLAFGLLFVLVPLLAYPACSPADYPEGCEVRCTTDDYGLPPSNLYCMNSGAMRCGEAQCDDGTPIDVGLCGKNGHATCKNGGEPRCLPSTEARTDASTDAAPDAGHQ